ncbi:MAG: TonB-dependent receptor [Sphingobacteriales bacterium]|nr:MAG: TonB-dependent receptor [Sphingobacteriales bacterium]
MRYLFTTLLLICFVAFQSIKAQDIQVSGKVTDGDTGEALYGVNIVVKGTTIGTISDFDGNYEMKVPRGSTSLVFSFVGYDLIEQEIGNGGKFDIALKPTSFELNATTITSGRRKERALDAPASISVIEAKQLKNVVTASPSDYLTTASGVDVMKTGLTGNAVVVRGFNNVFGGSLLTLVDYRIAAVPSLRVNAQQMIPTSPFDIQRIEVLKGPAAAMYGPNSANGVVHIITESPLDMKESFRTTLAAGVGLRSKVDGILDDNVDDAKPPLYDDGSRHAITGTLRHAGKAMNKKDGVKIGYKISGKYFTGFDWQYDDPNEIGTITDINDPNYGKVIVLNRQTAEGTIYTNDTVPNLRDNEIINYNFEGRVDFRFKKNMELIFTGGQNSFTGIEMTGLGAGQGKNWRYTFGQARFIWKNLFAQAYINTSNAGETYLYRSGNLIIDKSKFISGQIQHSSTLVQDRLKLIYGVDALLTRPDTESTINGRNEDDDNINEIGGYLQADFKVIDKLNLLLGGRVDKHTFVEDVFVSPRAAVVFKPNYNTTLRATYNRAFGSPSALNTSLDILSGALPTGIQVRGTGNRDGFFYSRDDGGLPQYRTPASALFGLPTSTYYNLGSDNGATAGYQLIVTGLSNGLKQIIEDRGLPIAPWVVDSIVAKILPASLTGVGSKVRMLNLATREFDEVDPSTIADFGSVKNSTTETYELGYKGIIKNKLLITADAYYTKIKDFVSPLVLRTPNVFLDPVSLNQYIAPLITENMANPANVAYAAVVSLALDTAQVVNGITVNGNSNGTGTDELITLITTAGAIAPYGTINPTSWNDPAMLLTYANVGNVKVWGAELGGTYFVNDNFRIGLNYAFVSDDEFEYEVGEETYTLALNAPRNKIQTAIDYSLTKIGLDIGLKYRWLQAFPVNTGVYVGDVDAANIVDLALGYALPFSKDTQISLSVQNVLGTKYRSVVGAPQIGRFTLFQIAHTFRSKN